MIFRLTLCNGPSMIFKDIEIYFLSASAVTRWGFTIGALTALIAFWYFSAFLPLLHKYSLIQSKVAQRHITDQEHELLLAEQAKNQTTVTQRLWFAAPYNNFLKDLVTSGLSCAQADIQKTEHHSGYSATQVKMVIEGTFEKFYDFCKTHHKNYLCQWNAVTCQLNPAGKLAIDADITIYSPIK